MKIKMNKFRPKLRSLICILLIGLFHTGCAKEPVETTVNESITDSNQLKWKGDNMSDFQAEGLSVSSVGSGLYRRVPYEERKVGLAYTTWCQSEFWNQSVWTFPTLGKYLSDDRAIIRKHAKWIADAGVDFIWIDWSNDVDYTISIDGVLTDKVRTDFAMIERSTLFIFEEYSKMRAEGKKTPNISIFIGNPAPGQESAVFDGRLTSATPADTKFYSVKEMLKTLDDYSVEEGDFMWELAYHAYPENLFESKTWNDPDATFSMNTPLITFKNLVVLNTWIKKPENLYKGIIKRTVWLSENGTNSKTYSEQDLKEQAAGFAYVWKILESMLCNGITG